jgi:gluconate 5-dehydrogenase
MLVESCYPKPGLDDCSHDISDSPKPVRTGPETFLSSWIGRRTPASRWGRLEELTGACIFLALDASSYVNGHILYVDGGMSACL